MSSAENITKLVGKAGKVKGREYVLKKDHFTIGAGSKCNLVIKGEYVSDLHASIQRRDDGVWVISNHSVNSTLVNRAAVDSKPLLPGDAIQIGAQALLTFEVEEPKKSRSKTAKTKSGKSEGKGLFQRPGIVAGLSLYLVVMLGGAIFLSGLSKRDDGGLSPERVKQSAEQTRAYLSNAEPEAGVAAAGLSADAAGDYYVFLSKKSKGETDERLLDHILDQANEHLTRAWHLESVKRYQAAIDAYLMVVETIPDIRAPISQLAMNKATQLRQDFPAE